jgi:hypothetical protein
MTRLTRTVRHLRDPRFRDRADGPPLSPSLVSDLTFIARLHWRHTPKLEFSWEGVATAIRESGAVVFADTSLFDDATPSTFWNALDEPTRLILTPGVRRELRPWMARRPNHPVVPMLQRTQHSPPDPVVVRLRASDAFAYYWMLLAARRQTFSLYTSVLAGELGRDPTEAELRRRIQQAVGERGYLLGRKGLTRHPGAPAGADDEVVYLATAYALVTGKTTMILTKDEDLQEQFYKLIWLLDTHYRATLLADYYAAAPWSFEHLGSAPDHPWVRGRFESLVLVRKPVAVDRRVLGREFHFVPVMCLLLGRQLAELTFGAETEMQRVLEVKAATGGLNTEKLSGLNLHFWLAPLPLPMELHDCVGLAADRRGPQLDKTMDRVPLFELTVACFVSASARLLRLSRSWARANASVAASSKPWIPSSVRERSAVGTLGNERGIDWDALGTAEAAGDATGAAEAGAADGAADRADERPPPTISPAALAASGSPTGTWPRRRTCREPARVG